MKVLVLSTMYPNSVMYLSGIFVHEQVLELKKLGLDVVVFAPIPFTPFPLNFLSGKWKLYSKIPIREIIEDVEVYHPRYVAIPKGILKDFWAYELARSVMNIIRETEGLSKIDLIHAHGSLPNDHAALILSRKLNKPFLVTVHGETVNYLINKRYFYRSRDALRNADAVIGVSNQVVRRIKEYTGRKNNVIRILNGYRSVKIESTKESSNLTILFAATLISRKGCDYLLKAFSLLSEEFKNIHLVLAGGGVLLDQMKKLASDLNISDKVTFKGTVNHQTMLKLMAACDIFILPSVDEAFGVVYLEAMSFKKPVIGTEGEGITDIIEDRVNGLLVKPKNVDSIVQKLKVLIESAQLRDELGTKGYNSIKELTWEKNARETFKIYEMILQRYHVDQ
jgi:glycosyltransferase involved in cell wall biosynthesis